MIKLETYRKAIAAFIGGALPLAAFFMPDVLSYLGPERIALISVIGSTLGAYFGKNTLEGVNVHDWAKWALEELAAAETKAEAEAPGQDAAP